VITALEKNGWVQRIVEDTVVLLTVPAGQVLQHVIELREAEKQVAVLNLLRGVPGVSGSVASMPRLVPT